MGLISNQWLGRGKGIRDKGYKPVPVSVHAVDRRKDDWAQRNKVPVEIRASAGSELQVLHLSLTEAEQLASVIVDASGDEARSQLAKQILRTMSDSELEKLASVILGTCDDEFRRQLVLQILGTMPDLDLLRVLQTDLKARRLATKRPANGQHRQQRRDGLAGTGQTP